MEWNEIARTVLDSYQLPDTRRMDVEVIAQHNAIQDYSPVVRRWHVDNAYAAVIAGGMTIRDLHFTK